MLYEYFDDALREWETSGGAMNYFPPDGHGPGQWEVLDAEDLDSAKEETVRALEAGGMTPSQIADEMSSWID